MPDELIALATALGVGLLIGAERERRKTEDAARAPAGIRTFTLAALTGALSLHLGGVMLFAVALAAIAVLAIAGYLRSQDSDPGLTTEVALLLTALIGGVATREPVLAAGVAVTVTILLAARAPIHRFVRSALSEAELNDALLLGAATLVVLPLVPDRFVGPFDAINPRTIWLIVVLTMAIGAAGHVAQRALGARLGLPFAGFASGFVSSSATIGSMGALARRTPSLARPAVSAAVLSSVATVVHLAVVLAATSRDTLRVMAIPLALAGIAAVGYGLLFLWRANHDVADAATHTADGHAFSLMTALGIAALLGTVLIASAALTQWLGTAGVTLAAGLAGFADAQSGAVSTASMVAAGRLSRDQAVIPVLVALTTNTVTKLLFAWTAGGARYATQLAPGLLLILAAAWSGAWLQAA